MKRRERRDNTKKSDCHINHAYKSYSLSVKNSIKEVSYTLSNSLMVEMKMNDYANNINEEMTRCIFINSKGTTTIGMGRPNQLVHHIRDVKISHQRKFSTKKKISKVLKFKEDDGKRNFINIKKR